MLKRIILFAILVLSITACSKEEHIEVESQSAPIKQVPDLRVAITQEVYEYCVLHVDGEVLEFVHYKYLDGSENYYCKVSNCWEITSDYTGVYNVEKDYFLPITWVINEDWTGVPCSLTDTFIIDLDSIKIVEKPSDFELEDSVHSYCFIDTGLSKLSYTLKYLYSDGTFTYETKSYGPWEFDENMSYLYSTFSGATIPIIWYTNSGWVETDMYTSVSTESFGVN